MRGVTDRMLRAGNLADLINNHRTLKMPEQETPVKTVPNSAPPPPPPAPGDDK